jgi:hypothetical protein
MENRRVVNVENIPRSLQERPQWVCWKSIPKSTGKPIKKPINALNGSLTDYTNPKNWATFEKALGAYNRNKSYAGIGYVFSEGDPYTGIDLDDCLDEQGEFIWGKDIVDRIDTYCEVSPSGRGVKMILEGTKPAWATECLVKGQGPNGDGKIEVYSRVRFFALTGRRIASAPEGILHRQEQLDALCAELWPDSPKTAQKLRPAEETGQRSKPIDEAMLNRMRACYKAIEAMNITDKGDGSHRLFAACCRCVEFDLPDEAALRVLAKYAKHHPFPTDWGTRSVLKRMRSAEKKVERGVALRKAKRIQPSMLSVGQLLKDHPDLRPPVINGLLRIGETMNIIAPPKYGKSWLITDLAMAVATGRRWLDAFDTVAGNVLILDNELHSETSANRIPKVAEARGIGLHEIADKLFIYNLRGRLLDVYTLQPYLESLQKGFFKVIVMDAFYRFLPKDSDENSNTNMTDVYNRLDWYAGMLGCSFVLVHHASKGNQSGKSVTDVGAGAGSQARATDTHLVLRQHQEDECVVVDAAVRSWQPINSICLRWSFPVWNIDDNLDASDLRPERPRKKPKPMEEQLTPAPKCTIDSFVASFVSDEPMTMKSIIATARETGVTQRMARDMIQLAEDAGLIHRWSFGANRPVKFATILQTKATLLET